MLYAECEISRHVKAEKFQKWEIWPEKANLAILPEIRRTVDHAGKYEARAPQMHAKQGYGAQYHYQLGDVRKSGHLNDTFSLTQGVKTRYFPRNWD